MPQQMIFAPELGLRSRDVLCKIAPGIAVLANDVADELSATSPSQLDDVFELYIQKTFVKIEPSAIGVPRGWFDTLSFEEFVETEPSATIRGVIKCLMDFDVSMHNALYESATDECDEEDINMMLNDIMHE